MHTKKILLLANSSWYIYNFRLPLIQKIRDNGYNLVIVAPKDKYSKLIEANGFRIIYWNLSRSSINPIIEFISIFKLFFIIKKINPKLIHNFTIKACIYGTIVSKFYKNIYVINTITGLGHLFISKRIETVILRNFIKPIYKIIFRSKRLFFIFQNLSDENYLKKFGLSNPGKSVLIKGSGVDTNYFKTSKKIHHKEFNNPVKLLFPSRIIREKGFSELLVAFKALINQGKKLQLLIAGEIDKGNKSTFLKKEIEFLKIDKNITLLGHVNNMKDLYEEIDIVVLPSWREGLSRALIEAASMQKAIITTDVPGCKDIIDKGISGILVPPRNSKAIELAIVLLINNQKLALKMGLNARNKVIKEFEVNLINKQTIKQYEGVFDI